MQIFRSPISLAGDVDNDELATFYKSKSKRVKVTSPFSKHCLLLAISAAVFDT